MEAEEGSFSRGFVFPNSKNLLTLNCAAPVSSLPDSRPRPFAATTESDAVFARIYEIVGDNLESRYAACIEDKSTK